MERHESLHEIYSRYLTGETSKEEDAILLRHFLEFGHETPLRQVIEAQFATNRSQAGQEQAGMHAALARVEEGLRARIRFSGTPTVQVGRFKGWLPYAAAAIIAVVLGSWLLTLRISPQAHDRMAGAAAILPGSNRATLTLEDGRTIALNESQQGIVVGKGVTYADGTNVLDGAQADPDTGKPSDGAHMVLTTPRGGVYRISLPDGSKVWLNANSTLKYPARFSPHERVIFLTGEAFFQVSTAKTPFRVVSAGQAVEVLGTEFNISAYQDDAVTKTTLVEGRVKVMLTDHAPIQHAVLNRGQQSALVGGRLQVSDVDTDRYVAWKSNEFMFDEASIDDVMKAVERWYDVNVVYEGPKPTDRLGGGVSRFEDVSKVLELLEQAGDVTFRLAGRTIYVKTKTK